MLRRKEKLNGHGILNETGKVITIDPIRVGESEEEIMMRFVSNDNSSI